MNISQEKLNEIIELHVKWLRGEKGGNCADLSGADLSYANLSSANLSKADLRGAYLSYADLRGADLSYAYLSNANLSSAYLSNANLSSAYLSNADLSYANLSSADLSYANLSSANLSSAYLDKTYYQISRIGSRNDITTYCVEEDNLMCGCWNNYKGATLAEFKVRVESVYGTKGITPNEKYYAEYIAAIKFFEKVRGEDKYFK